MHSSQLHARWTTFVHVQQKCSPAAFYVRFSHYLKATEKHFSLFISLLPFLVQKMQRFLSLNTDYYEMEALNDLGQAQVVEKKKRI